MTAVRRRASTVPVENEATLQTGRTVRPVPRATEPARRSTPRVPGESFNSELNLIAAVIKHGALEQVQAAGVTEEALVDEAARRMFRALVEHAARYGQTPSWITAAASAGCSSVKQPSVPEPLAYYLDQVSLGLRYEALGYAVADAAALLQERRVDEAQRILAEGLEREAQVFGGDDSTAGLLRGSDLLRRKNEPLRWLVEGVWVEGSYGMVGAAEKSLKSWVTTDLALAVASGGTFLGRFDVPSARPVLVYVGEGGERLITQRLKQLALGSNIDPEDIEGNLFFEVAAGNLDDTRALERLRRRVDATRAGLVIIDPWYRFHGGATNGANLFEQGALLSDVRDAAGSAALVIVHHFNQTGGKGTDLKRLALAGAAEWCDSWVLLRKEHEEPEQGQFLLKMDLGSRHWGGASWLVDASIGSVDPHTHALVGEAQLLALQVDDPEAAGDLPAGRRQDDPSKLLLHLLRDQPWQFTRSELQREFGGNKSKVLKLIRKLLEDGLVQEKPDPEDGRRTLLAATE